MSHIPILILGYNKFALTRQCLNVALDAGYPPETLHVVDNGSTVSGWECLVTDFPGVSCWRLERNRGFAGGCNFGLRTLFDEGHREVFFLSNDTAIEAGAAKACAQAACRNGAGLVAPAVLRWNGKELDSLGGWFDREQLRLFHCCEWNGPATLGPDEYVPGSAFWISKAAFEALGGMDEDYYSYWEDADLSFRARGAGVVLARCAGARVRHRGRATCGGKHRYTTYYYWLNRILFCRRHLDAAEWKRAESVLSRELKAVAETWKAVGDKARMAYLPELRSALS